MLNRKYAIIIFSVLAVALLWPAAMVAAPPDPAPLDSVSVEAPQAQTDLFPLYSSYDWVKDVGPADCPDQDPFPVFKYGTRNIYSYAPIYAKKDQLFGVLWYELDNKGKIIGEDPIAAATAEIKAGDALPFGLLTLNQAASGNVGVFMMSKSGKRWIDVASGVYVIAKRGVKVPQPGVCPVE